MCSEIVFLPAFTLTLPRNCSLVSFTLVVACIPTSPLNHPSPCHWFIFSLLWSSVYFAVPHCPSLRNSPHRCVVVSSSGFPIFPPPLRAPRRRVHPYYLGHLLATRNLLVSLPAFFLSISVGPPWLSPLLIKLCSDHAHPLSRKSMFPPTSLAAPYVLFHLDTCILLLRNFLLLRAVTGPSLPGPGGRVAFCYGPRVDVPRIFANRFPSC